MSNINDYVDKVDAAVDQDAQRAFHAAQLKASEVAGEIARGINDRHPGLHPAIVTTALVNCLASLVALAARGNVVKVLGTLQTIHDQTRDTALRLSDIHRKKAAEGAQAN